MGRSLIGAVAIGIGAWGYARPAVASAEGNHSKGRHVSVRSSERDERSGQRLDRQHEVESEDANDESESDDFRTGGPTTTSTGGATTTTEVGATTTTTAATTITTAATTATTAVDAAALFAQRRAGCNSTAPGAGLTAADIGNIITNGISSTGMPGFSSTLSTAQITALANYLADQ